MPRIQCANKIACPGDDLALTNFSSEDPDRFLFLSRSYGYNDVTPIDDDNIIIDQCVTFASSPISQQDADLCGDRHQKECTHGAPLADPCQVCRPAGIGNQPASFGDFGLSAGSAAAASASPCCNPGDPQGCCCDNQNADPDPTPGPGPNPNPGPDPHPHPNPHPPKLYGNDRQTCTVLCPDGTAYSSSVEEGLYVAVSKALANSMAHSAACKSANETRICPHDPYTDKCKVFCADEDGSFQIEAESRSGADLTYTISDGSLPDGMTMDDAGLITGTPDSMGQSATVEVSICDDEDNCLIRNICFSVMGIIEDSLPDGAVESAYSAQLHGSGGVSPYSFHIINGGPPDGTLMDTHGAFTGIPTKVGDFPFAVRIVDAEGNLCEKGFSIHINGVANTAQTVTIPCSNDPSKSVTVTIPAGTINHAPGYDQFTADAEARQMAFDQASAILQTNGCGCFVKSLNTTGSNHAGVIGSNAGLGCSLVLQGVDVNMVAFPFPFTAITIQPAGDAFSAPNTVNLDAYWDNLIGNTHVTFTVGFIPNGKPFIPSNVLFWWTHHSH